MQFLWQNLQGRSLCLCKELVHFRNRKVSSSGQRSYGLFSAEANPGMLSSLPKYCTFVTENFTDNATTGN